MQDNPFGITRNMVLEILTESSKAMKWFLKKFKKKFDVKLSGKLLSEIFSNLLEQKASKVFSKRLGYEVKKAISDNTPDLLFTKINLPMEIKVTSGQVWRGGEFSKRASWHLMVSRNETFDEFFVCLVNMHGNGGLWVSAMQQGKDYYAPSFKKDSIFDLQKQIPIFVGKILKTERGAVKLILESV